MRPSCAEDALRIILATFEPECRDGFKQQTIGTLRTLTRTLHADGVRAHQAFEATRQLYDLFKAETIDPHHVHALLDRGAGMHHPRYPRVLEFALLYAACGLHMDLAERLIRLGADVNHVFAGPHDLLDDSAPRSALHAAAQSLSIPMIDLLVNAGADINLKHPDDHKTPLFMAVESMMWLGYEHDPENVVRHLLERGARVDEFGLHRGKPLTVLMFAARHDDPINSDVVRLLVKHSRCLDLRTDSGMTALHMACETQPEDVIAEFLRRGADPNARDLGGWTPLITACNIHEKFETIIDLLVDAGADVSARGRDGSTALGGAIEVGSRVGVTRLLAAGAVPDNSMVTPGIRREYPDLLHLLSM